MYLDDALCLASTDVIGTVAEVELEIRSFLAPYAAMLTAPVAEGEWWWQRGNLSPSAL